MGKTLQNLFKTYYSQLIKLDIVLATKSDLIVIEETTLKSVFTSKVNLNKKFDSFSLNDRDKILEHVLHI